MKNYTEPKLEIVTLEVSDVITASGLNFESLFTTKVGGTEYAGRVTSMSQFEI